MTETPLSVKVLQTVLATHQWNQEDLARESQLHRSVVSMHLSRQRAVRDEHLIAYLSALDRNERRILTAAWLRDAFSSDVVSDVLDVQQNRLREEVTTWSPGLTLEQERMLAWWKESLARDPELAEIFRGITAKAGYPNPYEQLTIAVVVTDAAGLTTYINPAFTAMCGHPIEKLRGRKPGQILQGPATERDAAQAMSQAIRERRPHECTITNYHARGHTYRSHIKLTPVFDPLGTLIQFRAIEQKVD